jgi:hypothetical protein
MISLAGVPYWPRHGVAVTGDWKTVVIMLFVIALAFGAMAVISYRSSRPQPTSKHEHEPVDSDRKAA